MHDNDTPNRRVDASPYVAQAQPGPFQPAPFVAPQPIIPPLGAQVAPGYGYAQPAPGYPQPAPHPAPVYAQPYAPPHQAAPQPGAAAYQAPQTVAAPSAVAAAQGAPQRAEPVETDDYSVVEFSKAYKAHDETVQRIKIRKPLAREIRKFGNPLRPVMDDAGRVVDVEVKWEVVANYIPALSDPPLPPSTVDRLEFFDLDACAGAISRFFVRL